MQQIPDIIRLVPLQNYIWFSTALFCIGIVGVLTRRNAIIIFMSVELMLNAVNLLLAAFSSYKSDPAGQIFVFFIDRKSTRLNSSHLRASRMPSSA